MESLKGMFQQLRPAAPGPSPTVLGTNASPRNSVCGVCNDAGWLLLPGRDREGFPFFRACHACALGHPDFLRGLGFAPNERIEPFESFDTDRQPDRRNRNQAALALAQVRAWVGGALVNLILSGPTGVGKTHLSKAAIYEAGLRNLKPGFVTGPDFEKRVKNFALADHVRERQRAHLIETARLAFDDIGFGGKDESPYMRGQLEDLFDGRYRRGLGTLLTTNLTQDEFRTYAGVRVFDRLTQDGQWVYMPGVSQRAR